MGWPLPPEHAIVTAGALIGIMVTEPIERAADAIVVALHADAPGVVTGLAAHYFEALELLAEGLGRPMPDLHDEIGRRLCEAARRPRPGGRAALPS